LSFSGPEVPQIQLAQYLREKDLLLVLDNCEHLPVARFAVELLEQAPQLTILTTSRGRLNVGGEQVVELEGLDFPTIRPLATEDRRLKIEDSNVSCDDTLSTIHYPLSSDKPSVVGHQSSDVDLESYSAVQLFRYNARAVNPRLTWTNATITAAARICELVTGLPLGIELAASLVRLMSCEEIAHELAASLEFLQSSRSDLPERHQSLRALFEHSWKLLEPSEQRTLRQLSVFRGGFRRDAAAQIAGASIALLGTLVDNSLVRRSVDGHQGVPLVVGDEVRGIIVSSASWPGVPAGRAPPRLTTGYRTGPAMMISASNRANVNFVCSCSHLPAPKTVTCPFNS
jgi:predicted ATPase